MFARYLKAQLIVLLCGGIVGPIFVITFFFVRNSFGVSMLWMFYVGLFITALGRADRIGAGELQREVRGTTRRRSNRTGCWRWRGSPAWARRACGSMTNP